MEHQWERNRRNRTEQPTDLTSTSMGRYSTHIRQKTESKEMPRLPNCLWMEEWRTKTSEQSQHVNGNQNPKLTKCSTRNNGLKRSHWSTQDTWHAPIAKRRHDHASDSTTEKGTNLHIKIQRFEEDVKIQSIDCIHFNAPTGLRVPIINTNSLETTNWIVPTANGPSRAWSPRNLSTFPTMSHEQLHIVQQSFSESDSATGAQCKTSNK